jgi:exopolyphosphatase/pppGpp-phosphohydrolase
MTNENLMDVRTAERHIARGKLSREAYNKAMAALEDCADDALATETEMIRHIADEDGVEEA